MAYTELPIDIVFKWCDNTLKSIDEDRKEKIEKRVLYYMQPTKVFGIVIGNGMTREEAYAYVMMEDVNMQKEWNNALDDYLARKAYDGQYKKVEKIKNLCMQTQQNGLDMRIKMSDDDLSSLITD